MGTGGVLYGTTAYGGTLNWGTVFSLTPPSSPGGSWTESVLYNFTGGTDGGTRFAPVVIGSGGVLYGTAHTGGVNGGQGTVFSLAHLRPQAEPGPRLRSMISWAARTGLGRRRVW